MLLWFQEMWCRIKRIIRRLQGKTKVLSVILEFPDLPTLDTNTLEYIERLTATPQELEFGSLSHYVNDQSHGRLRFVGSNVVNLGPVLPDWADVFDPPSGPNLPPTENGWHYTIFKAIIEQHIGRQILDYDILYLFYNGLLVFNAITQPMTYSLSEKFLIFFKYTCNITLPTVTIGLSILENRFTSSICHELFHTLQYNHNIIHMDHAPYLEADESGCVTNQRNPWHSLSHQIVWGQTIPFFDTLAVGVSAYNCNRLGWYHSSEHLTLTAPLTNKKVRLRTTFCPPQFSPVSPVVNGIITKHLPLAYLCEINTSGLPNHPEGYVLEARARQGYDQNLHDSGVLVHKLAMLEQTPSVGYVPFLLGPLPPAIPDYSSNNWSRYVLTPGENFEREGIHIEVTDVISDSNGVPLVFELNITIQ